MNVELVTIGTELLLGFTIDTNSAEIARLLAARGVRIVRRTTVPDEPGAIRGAVGGALRRTGAVLTTGGLGPTRDDITKHAVAELFGAPLEFDAAVWDELVERFTRLGRVPAESNRSQAMVPHGARVLPNRWGTAPGLWLEGRVPADGGDALGLVVMLPGVPREMRKLLEHEVVPRLAPRGSAAVIRSRQLRTTGIAESSLAERIGEIEPAIAPLTLAYLPGTEGVDLRLTAWEFEPDEAEARLDAAAALLAAAAGDHFYGLGEARLAGVVLEEARRRGVRIGVAESCTGGMIGERLTAIPGSSDVFLGGVIAYDDAVKTELLGVPGELLATHGAVSGPVAHAMAVGTCRTLGVDAAMSVTGIAGPGGGSEAKPVGTVWLGTSVAGRTEVVHTMLFGSRREIRERAAQAALFLLYRRLRATR